MTIAGVINSVIDCCVFNRPKTGFCWRQQKGKIVLLCNFNCQGYWLVEVLLLYHVHNPRNREMARLTYNYWSVNSDWLYKRVIYPSAESIIGVLLISECFQGNVFHKGKVPSKSHKVFTKYLWRHQQNFTT